MISNPAPGPKNYPKIRIRDSENPVPEQLWYAHCYTLCVNRWRANKEGQGPRRNFDARFLLSYGKNIGCGFQPGSGGPHTGCEEFVERSPEDILCT